MKTILLWSISFCSAMLAAAQPQLDTSKLMRDTVRSAWSQRPDTAGFRQQPISSQPFSNPPTPAQTTNPIDNPTSGQSNPPAYNPPVDLPPATPKGKAVPRRAKPATPITPVPKRSDYDTLPGTKRNG